MRHIKTQLGAHEDWYKNSQKAKRNGLKYCDHCGKGMKENTGFLFRFVYQTETIVPFNAEIGEIKLVGLTCFKNFAFDDIPADYFVKLSA